MKQPPRKPLPSMLNEPAQNPKETTLILNLSEWDHLRMKIAVRELRLRSRMRIPAIADALKMTPDEVRDCLREPRSTLEILNLSGLTVSVRVLDRPKYRFWGSTVLVKVKNVFFQDKTDSSR